MRLIDADVYKGTLNMLRYGNHLNRESVLNLAEIALDEQPTIDSYEWISVKDRMPEQYSYVIVFTGLEVTEAFYDGWRFGCTSKSHPISVTHWMPLPEPPKGDE